MTRRTALSEMIGKTLSHYRITAALGKGGMGEVWIAEDTRLHRKVALKTLGQEVAAGPDRHARFEREAQAIAALNHPNIVTIHSVEEAEGVRFITMELVEGKTLTELIPSGGLPLDRFFDIAIQLADALDAAHCRGITHRDLKPDNVMVTADGRVKVLDFGLAKLVAGDERASDAEETATKAMETVAGTVLGTVAYMSPEQTEGRAVDARSDVFSLGVVLYEMATGCRPFAGETAARLISSILRDEPSPVDSVRPDCPGDLGDLLGECLEKNPEGRSLTAADVGNRLRSLSQERMASGAVAAMSTTGKPKRTGLVVALGLVAVALAVSTAWYVGNRGGRDARPAGEATGDATPFAARRLSQLTFEAEPEQWPAWSPEGKRLAYCRESGGYSKLFVKDLNTNESRQLTHGPRDDIQPEWSPDGNSLVFVRANTEGGKLEPGDALTGEYDGGDVWLLDLESGAESLIIDEAFNPAFSWDGSRLAVDASWAGPRRIWISDAHGRNPDQVTTDTSEAVQHVRPAWSPDGTRLAYQHDEKTKLDIHVVNLATGTTVKVTDDLYQDLNPVWSASGKYIYLSSYRGGGLNIWRTAVGPDGTPTGAPEQLTTGAGQDIQPSLASDGTRLAFTVLQQNADLWRLPTDPATGRATGDAEALIVSTREDSRGAWSPDGGLLAFNSDRDGEMNIWLFAMEDGSTRPLTRGPGGDYQPKWSPNGRSIAFFSARAGNADIWTVDVESGELSQVTDDPALDTNPFFSPDGERIAFQSDRDGRKEVWLVDADGSDVRQLASVGVTDHFMRWSADGDFLYFRSSALPQNSVCRVAIEGGQVEPTGIPVGWHMSFSPDDSLILDAVGHKGLWVYPIDGTERREVFVSDDPGARVDYPDWSSDGRWVVFDRVVPRGGDIWLLEGLE